jgi:hypothetical protein
VSRLYLHLPVDPNAPAAVVLIVWRILESLA